jgi:hypothetical protein
MAWTRSGDFLAILDRVLGRVRGGETLHGMMAASGTDMRIGPLSDRDFL